VTLCKTLETENLIRPYKFFSPKKEKHQKISKSIEKYQKISKSIKKYRKASKSIEKYRKASKSIFQSTPLYIFATYFRDDVLTNLIRR
jgi:hypothetical protein